MANLIKRQQRVYYAKGELVPTSERYRALSKVQDRIWNQMAEIGQAAYWEEIEELWPNGLPAHP
jgi:hypothetical protein